MTELLPSDAPYARELAVALDAARRAADAVMGFYTAHSAETYTKGDGSPVTDADLAADTLLREIIGGAFPEDAFLTEEGAASLERRNHARVWIIDPIDGTAQFIAGTGRFDILIALAERERPVVAVAMQPATGLIHAAVTGAGAWRVLGDDVSTFRTNEVPTPPRLTSSKYYRGHEGRDLILRVAERLGAGEPPVMDVGFQPRAFDASQRTYDAFIGLQHAPGQSAANEWDIATSDLIIREAGGRVSDLWGRDFIYNKRDTHISAGIVASASVALHETLLEALAPELPAEIPALDPADDLDEMAASDR